MFSNIHKRIRFMLLVLVLALTLSVSAIGLFSANANTEEGVKVAFLQCVSNGTGSYCIPILET